MAKTAPQQLGLPFTTWSLTKLVEHLAKAHRIVVSAETVRQVLREASISWQATRTWKGSRDPEFIVKMARILQLYDQAAAGQILAGGRVICVDEFGPLNLQPRPGQGWFEITDGPVLVTAAPANTANDVAVPNPTGASATQCGDVAAGFLTRPLSENLEQAK